LVLLLAVIINGGHDDADVGGVDGDENYDKPVHIVQHIHLSQL